jgi:hypothetical protein
MKPLPDPPAPVCTVPSTPSTARVTFNSSAMAAMALAG